MCVINFDIVTVGTPPLTAEGRYRIIGATVVNWITFNINMLDMKTPDIVVNGEYELQIRVQYPDLSYSQWTTSSPFKVGNCDKLGNMYATMQPGVNCNLIKKNDFTSIFYSNEEDSGDLCYTPSVGAKLFLDSDLVNKVPVGEYMTFGAFNGCFPTKRILVIGTLGEVASIKSCPNLNTVI